MCSSLDEAKACFLEPLDLLNKSYIFMPLNNNKIIEKTLNDQGSHWSLLIINLNDSILTHYDSLSGGANQTEAKLFFQKYKSYFRLDKFIEADNYPRQNNSSDCGIFVCGKNLV
jgi:Ulp1 family protease